MEKFIKKASRIGASYIKFQLFDAEKLNKDWPDYENAYKHYKQCQLSEEDLSFIIDTAKGKSIIPLATAFDIQSAKIWHKFSGGSSVKIASPDCNNWELLYYCLTNFSKVFISLGMHHGYEVKRLLLVPIEKATNVIPMYCRSLYPVKQYTVDDFRAMEYLKENFKEWGLSDHSEDSTNALTIMKGLKPGYIERHFTLEKTGKKDDIVSSTPEDMARLTSYPFPTLSDEEIKNRKYINRWR
ncbi:MAG: N-acetylneuraminate synthase family protein [Deltaproteobacteria bacterium]|nr:N-acetylneuraminate synthase family protein [Deltaproteobacteria bacterium]